MSLLETLFFLLILILGYSLSVFVLHKMKILDKYGISFYGPALLLRTKKGRSFLKKLASVKRFWHSFGNFGILFCFLMMFLVVALLIFNTWAVLGFTAEQKQALPGIEYALVIPGLNPILPLEYIVYILLALIIAVIVHEFSHGILTIAGNLKVKSLGILYLIIPLGAFCEPDEEELRKTKTSNRMRVYAAGPTSNFVVVLVSLLLFSFVLMPAVSNAADGVGIIAIADDAPADDIGMKTGMILTHLNDSKIDSIYDFVVVMNSTRANQTINVSYASGKQIFTKAVVLSDKYEEYSIRFPNQNNVSYKGKGYLGVGLNPYIDFLPILKNPFGDFPNNLLLFYIVPLLGLEGYNPIFAPFTNSYVVSGPLGAIPQEIFWGIVNALYWIFWLNLAVALFNVLPMIPLDGGFLFSDGIGSILKKVKSNISDETKDKIKKNVTTLTSLVILVIVLFPWLIKYF